MNTQKPQFARWLIGEWYFWIVSVILFFLNPQWLQGLSDFKLYGDTSSLSFGAGSLLGWLLLFYFIVYTYFFTYWKGVKRGEENE